MEPDLSTFRTADWITQGKYRCAEVISETRYTSLYIDDIVLKSCQKQGSKGYKYFVGF